MDQGPGGGLVGAEGSAACGRGGKKNKTKPGGPHMLKAAVDVLRGNEDVLSWWLQPFPSQVKTVMCRACGGGERAGSDCEPHE